jgi:hypothetical protein
MHPPVGELTIEVKGSTPVPRGLVPKTKGRQQTWRGKVAKAATEVKERLGPLLVEPTAEFNIEIEYRLTDLGVDLDNLTKPVLDTLFENINPNAPEYAGMLFDADDSRIVRLLLTKVQVSSEKDAGVRIDVSWANPG